MSNLFAVQRAVRRPWRRYIDRLTEHRPRLHAYCCRLTGNVWDGEDLVQDTLVRVFSLLGKTNATLENPRAYLIRTATNLWIDRVRWSAREQAALVCAAGYPALKPKTSQYAQSSVVTMAMPRGNQRAISASRE
jgi:RNA polymerase sigma-70 factor (ECF subfamily)